MAALADTRKSCLDIVNEVRRKLALAPVSALNDDNESKVLLDYVNDIIEEINDYGNWKELLKETIVTASSSVARYIVNTSADIKNIYEIAVSGQVASMRLVPLEDMRRFERLNTYGTPYNWCIVGVDNVTTGAPIVQMYPTPRTPVQNFKVTYFEKVPQYTASADSATVPPFPARMIIKGVLGKALQDETRDGTDSAVVKQEFQEMLRETYNRFNGDSGVNVQFVMRRGFRRRP
jgi:hypothetical protein